MDADPASVPKDTAIAVIEAAEQPMNRGNVIIDIEAEIRAGNNWGQMLAAAPIAIELLGSCSVMASSLKSGRNKLTEPAKGYQYLRG